MGWGVRWDVDGYGYREVCSSMSMSMDMDMDMDMDGVEGGVDMRRCKCKVQASPERSEKRDGDYPCRLYGTCVLAEPKKCAT